MSKDIDVLSESVTTDRAETDKLVHKALAARLAQHKISDAVVAKIADRIIRDGAKIGRFDFCPYGICVDYFTDKRILVDKLIANEKFRAVRLFPYGIPVDDIFHVRVEMQIPELAGRIGQ